MRVPKTLDLRYRDCECEDCSEDAYMRRLLKHPRSVVCWCGGYRLNHVALRERTHTWLNRDHHFGRHDSLPLVATEYEVEHGLPPGATNPSSPIARREEEERERKRERGDA